LSRDTDFEARLEALERAAAEHDQPHRANGHGARWEARQ
jgi:hypothetical protein